MRVDGVCLDRGWRVVGHVGWEIVRFFGSTQKVWRQDEGSESAICSLRDDCCAIAAELGVAKVVGLLGLVWVFNFSALWTRWLRLIFPWTIGESLSRRTHTSGIESCHDVRFDVLIACM